MKNFKSKSGSPILKQQQSCAKAISVAIITVSGMLSLKDIEEKDVEENIFKRLRAIQRKYGYPLFKRILPEVSRRFKQRPYIMMKFPKGSKNVRLLYENLDKYYVQVLKTENKDAVQYLGE